VNITFLDNSETKKSLMTNTVKKCNQYQFTLLPDSANQHQDNLNEKHTRFIILKTVI